MLYCSLHWKHFSAAQTLVSYSEGPGFEVHSVRMPLDKAFYPHLSLSIQVYKWVPDGNFFFVNTFIDSPVYMYL